MKKNSQDFMKRTLTVLGLCTLIGTIDANAPEIPLNLSGDSTAVFDSYYKIGYTSGNIWIDQQFEYC